MRNCVNFESTCESHSNMYCVIVNKLTLQIQSSRDRDFQYLYCKRSSRFSDACKSPLHSCFILMFNVSHYQQYTEQNFVVDVEIQKTRKAAWA